MTEENPAGTPTGEPAGEPTGPLAGKTAIVTGSSRGIGAEVARLLGAAGAGVVVNYRQKAPRANKVVAGIEAAGGRAVAVGADLTAEGGAQALVDAARDTFGGLDILVLNASGGMEADLGEDYAMRLNRDAQVSMLEAAVTAMPTGSRVVFVTSHQAHFIDTVPTMPEYEAVARSKRAGEDALRQRQPELTGRGISLVVVSGDMIEGTVTATLLDRARPGTLDERRSDAGRLYSVEEFAAEVARMVTADVPTGHTEYVGGADHMQ
ncbi:short chain dehydrogenase [Tersicoccus phoenicis]|uniref:Short chain dehydrogenase n=1 Tax=Tersicoccus phoenicis TaxID=554083 RepID=A0A1R1LFL2_9MICC|nr:SDR family oxidoreductase [Tersicoccus phoenicis]OMH26316.1 short chain dehydrogenase [Tersicoccus phoenicis]